MRLFRYMFWHERPFSRRMNKEVRMQFDLQFGDLSDRLDKIEVWRNSSASSIPTYPVSDMLNKQEQMIEYLHQQLSSQAQTIAQLQSDVHAQRQENDGLKQQVALAVQQIDALTRQSEEQTRAIHELWRQLAVIKKTSETDPAQRPSAPGAAIKNAESVKPVVTSQPEPSSVSSVQKKSEKPWISFFSLPVPTTREAFFSGDAAAIQVKFAQSIQMLASLLAEVQQLPLEEGAGNSFFKNLRHTKDSLENFYQKFDFKRYDEDELSEKVTEKFFKVIGDNILDNVIPGIYRGGQSAPGYADLLQKLNGYLSRYGIYTLGISPGTVLTSDLSDHIEIPILKQTSAASEDGKIAEVELLPYFIDYEDDDGNIAWLRKRGRVIGLKYREMK